MNGIGITPIFSFAKLKGSVRSFVVRHDAAVMVVSSNQEVMDKNPVVLSTVSYPAVRWQ